MDVVSLSPLRVASLVWQPRRGAWVLTVVCKATYKLQPGTSRLAEGQEYPNDDDNHWNDDPARSLYSPSDLAPFKQRADVMLVGHAFAPHGEPARSVVARLRVGTVDKAIEVFGDRVWLADGSLREVSHFTKMPLRFERAWSGAGNPVGMRVEAADAYGMIAVPNLQAPGVVATSPSAALEPVGFGPIAPAWAPRAQKLGRHADGFQQGTWQRQPLPEGLDPRYFNAAPPDQQLDALADDPSIVLEHLHPEHAMLVTRLSGVHPRAFAEPAHGAVEELEMTCDTLWIDTDRSLCTLTWRGQVPVESPMSAGRVLVAMENPGEELTWDEVKELAEVELQEDEEEEGTFLVDQRAIDSGTKTKVAVTAPRRTDAPPAAAPAPSSLPPAADATASALRIEVPAATAGASAWARASAFAATQEDLMNVTVAATEGLRNALPFVPAAGSERRAPELAPGDAAPPWLAGRAPAGAAPASSALPFATPQPPAASSPASSPPAAPAHPANAPAVPALSPPAPPAPASQTAPGDVAPPAVAVPPAPASQATSTMAAPIPAPIAPEVVELLWFEAAALPRLRADARLRAALSSARTAEPTAGEAPSAESRDRRDAFAILTRAPALGADGVAQAIEAAVDPDGGFVPPLVSVAGELAFPFDEVGVLKATLAAVSPLVGADDKLRELVAAAAELCASPWAEGAGAIAQGLTARLEEAFARGHKALPSSYLAAGTERLLLEQRAFQRCTVLGDRHLRALVTLAGAGAPIPVYLPELLAKRLPLFKSMRARLLAEAHAQQDAGEACPHALRVVALGRVLPVGRR